MPNTNSTQRLPSLYAGGQARSSPSSAAECEDTSLTDLAQKPKSNSTSLLRALKTWLPAPEDDKDSTPLGNNSFIIPLKANPATRCHQVFWGELPALLQSELWLSWEIQALPLRFDKFCQIAFSLSRLPNLHYGIMVGKKRQQRNLESLLSVAVKFDRLLWDNSSFLMPASLGKEVTVSERSIQWHFSIIPKSKISAQSTTWQLTMIKTAKMRNQGSGKSVQHLSSIYWICSFKSCCTSSLSSGITRTWHHLHHSPSNTLAWEGWNFYLLKLSKEDK